LNGTDAINQAVTGLVEQGDHIVTTRLEHNAVLRTVNHMERDNGLSVTRVQPGSAGYISVDDIAAAITDKTGVIILNHASNVVGTVQPLADIAALARRNSIPLIVDAAQTAGVLPINMDELGISVLTFPGHKGLFGPMGIGGMIISESIDLAPNRFGGTGVDSISTYQPEAYPYRLEAGTVSIPGIAGLNAAQHWFRELGLSLANADGVENASNMSHRDLCVLAMNCIHHTELTHVKRIESALKKYPAVRIVGEAIEDARVATISFTVNSMSIQRIVDQLDADHQICARAGLQCAPLVHVDAGTADDGGTIRLSPGYFTDEDDMQQLLNGLHEILS